MNKKELFDALDGFSQNLLVTLAEVEAIKNDEECMFCDELLFRE